MIERVCVAGAGVIGSLIAGHLAQVANVTVLCRREEHAHALNAEGLRISGKADFTAPVTAAVSADELPEPDLVVVATKAHGLEAAVSSLAGHWPGALVMPVLNGLGAEEIVRRYGDWRLISSVTFLSGTKHSDTHVQYILDTETWLAPYEETPFELAQEAGDLIESRVPGFLIHLPECLPGVAPQFALSHVRGLPRKATRRRTVSIAHADS
jgi:2-dehydropantoate 2-reductase